MRAILTAAIALAGLTTIAMAADTGDAFKYMTKEQAFDLVKTPKADGSATNVYYANHGEFSEQIVQRTVSGKVETHELWTDYMVVVDGNATITIGGKVTGNAKNPNGAAGEWLGTSSAGGKVYDLKPGVTMIIPKGIPHWMQLAKGAKLQYIAFKRKG